MHALFSRWILKASFSLAVAAGGALWGALPAHGQSITGLGQTDQVFSVCRYPAVADATACSDQSNGGVGKHRP